MKNAALMRPNATLPDVPPLGAKMNKVWRVPVHAEELIAHGWKEGIDANEAWDTIIKPILLKKGLPEGFTLERTPCRMSPTKTGVMLEFV